MPHAFGFHRFRVFLRWHLWYHCRESANEHKPAYNALHNSTWAHRARRVGTKMPEAFGGVYGGIFRKASRTPKRGGITKCDADSTYARGVDGKGEEGTRGESSRTGDVWSVTDVGVVLQKVRISSQRRLNHTAVVRLQQAPGDKKRQIRVEAQFIFGAKNQPESSIFLKCVSYFSVLLGPADVCIYHFLISLLRIQHTDNHADCIRKLGVPNIGGCRPPGSPDTLPRTKKCTAAEGWVAQEGVMGMFPRRHTPPATPFFLCIRVSIAPVSYWDDSYVVT